ncbi:hypothetical protein ACFE04_017230 [Oxalis oulophora]
MPSRPLLPPPPTEAVQQHHHHHFNALPVILATTLTLTFLILVVITIFLYRKLTSRKQTATAPSPNHHHCRRFSYTSLRRATASFSQSNRLGHGGFGSVYKAVLPSSGGGGGHNNNQLAVAVKVMDSAGSLQGEREFHNELSLASYLAASSYVVSLLGFSSDRRRRRLVLVYELMENRSLQDALLGRKCVELMEWRKRFEKKRDVVVEEDNGSILEETESVLTGYEEVIGRSPESCNVQILDSEPSPEPENVSLSPEVGIDKSSIVSLSEACFSVESGRDLGGGCKKVNSRRDWWWKQDNNGGGSESGRIKDYVMEWIGSEIKKERPMPLSVGNCDDSNLKAKQKKDKIRKNRKPREWWKEEFCEELAKKNKKKRGGGGDLWWQKEELNNKKKKRKSKSSLGSSIDWWLEGFSGEFRMGRRNSRDWTSLEIPKSGGISSTPSMRGTVCYIAPEYGGGGLLSEKCDVYSFGVLLLVLISGRRPLQVLASPMSEFERANLISWARQLARNGKLLDLVDPSIHSLDKEQCLLCITIAMLCLQKSPGKRPSMKDVVLMLVGEAEPPHLPFEFSPSPPSNFPFKSRKKAR